MIRKKREEGQAGLEFVIITPVLLLAIFLLTIIGNKLYNKLSTQNFAYSHCMWELTEMDVIPDEESAFSMVVDGTKINWNIESVWEDYPLDAESADEFDTKTCVGSVTYLTEEKWKIMGNKYSSDYKPELLIESRLTIYRTQYTNTNLRFNLPNLGIRMEK
jgi:hypothetical protein